MKPRVAFDNCPNNVWRKDEEGSEIFRTHLEVVCPQYPFGSKDVVSVPDYNVGTRYGKGQTAKALGCATCQFRDTPMQRIDTQELLPDGSMQVNVTFRPIESDG